jgi:hypothetical protein
MFLIMYEAHHLHVISSPHSGVGSQPSPQGPTIVGTGNGTPEVPELPSTWGYSWTTLSPGVINMERSNAGEGQQQIYCTELKQFR